MAIVRDGDEDGGAREWSGPDESRIMTRMKKTRKTTDVIEKMNEEKKSGKAVGRMFCLI